MLLARLLASLPLIFPNCGADKRTMALLTEVATLTRVLTHSGGQQWVGSG